MPNNQLELQSLRLSLAYGLNITTKLLLTVQALTESTLCQHLTHTFVYISMLDKSCVRSPIGKQKVATHDPLCV